MVMVVTPSTCSTLAVGDKPSATLAVVVPSESVTVMVATPPDLTTFAVGDNPLSPFGPTGTITGSDHAAVSLASLLNLK